MKQRFYSYWFILVIWNTEQLWASIDLRCRAEGRVLVVYCNVQVFLPLLHFPHWRCFLLHQSRFHPWDARNLLWKVTVSSGWMKLGSWPGLSAGSKSLHTLNIALSITQQSSLKSFLIPDTTLKWRLSVNALNHQRMLRKTRSNSCLNAYTYYH